MKKKLYSLKEIEGKCPFCSSSKILKQGAFGTKVGGSSNKLPDPNIEVWRCDSCTKTFEVLRSKS
jgi:transposase-like protein